jgi:hypothetical protein
VYTLYCGIASLPIPYGVKEKDVTSILECLADCDADPEFNPICYYSETPTSYGPTDDPEAVLAVRAGAPDPYLDGTTSSSSTISSSSSSEVPPVYEGSTT